MTLSIERDLDEVRTGLDRWLGRPVGRLERPDPGFSCETLIADGEVVIRLPPLGEGAFPVYDLAQQAAVQGAVATSEQSAMCSPSTCRSPRHSPCQCPSRPK